MDTKEVCKYCGEINCICIFREECNHDFGCIPGTDWAMCYTCGKTIKTNINENV